jgi:hypothetical protein
MEQTQEQDFLMDKKIEYLVDMRINKLKNDLAQALGNIQKMNEEIEILKNKVQRLNLGVNPQTKLAVKTNSSTEKKEESKSTNSNARTGSIKPEDVSIEKMFYFGNK